MTKTPTFEQRLTRLQEVVEKLDSEDLTLEESISLYREGQTLSKACGEQLFKAKNEVKRITEDWETLPFIEQSEESR